MFMLSSTRCSSLCVCQIIEAEFGCDLIDEHC